MTEECITKKIPIERLITTEVDVEFEPQFRQYGGHCDYDEIPDNCRICNIPLNRCEYYSSKCYCGKNDEYFCCDPLYYCNECIIEL